MVAAISRQSIKLNIGKISKTISDLELQRKKIYENIVQLKQARDRLIIQLRNIPAAEKARERHIKVEDVKAGTDPFPTDDVIKCRSNDMVETSSDLFPTNDDCLLAVTTVYNDQSNNNDVVTKDLVAEHYITVSPQCDDDENDEFWTAFASDLPEEPMEYRDTSLASDDNFDEPIVISDDEDEQLGKEIKSSVQFRKPFQDISNSVFKVSRSLSNFKFKTPPKPAGNSTHINDENERPSTSCQAPAALPSKTKAPAKVAVPKIPRPAVFKPPNPVQTHAFQVPGVQKPAFKQSKQAKSKQGKHFEAQHIIGDHRANKPVNSKAAFNRAEYYLLRPSGKRDLARGKLIDQVKCVTKQPISYSGTGWKNGRIGGWREGRCSW